ncbi:hypothetical protein B0T37_10660 [Chromobacterium violaceum]|nr:hypothetical protein B0T38_11055 [Chromobacterium violaceum]OQS26514.1 hypothetical protein B0T37_10660 [Chromobacterium violaceum]
MLKYGVVITVFAIAARAAFAVSAVPTYDGPLKCESKTVDDLWMDHRLGCLKVGQQFVISSASGAGQSVQGKAFTINQKLTTSDWVALNGKVRYFQHFLCIRNMPSGVAGWQIAGDIGQATKSTGSIFKVPGIVHSSTAQSGGIEVGPCDPAKHPVIVDYNTGKIESVNPEALKAINVYELPAN